MGLSSRATNGRETSHGPDALLSSLADDVCSLEEALSRATPSGHTEGGGTFEYRRNSDRDDQKLAAEWARRVGVLWSLNSADDVARLAPGQSPPKIKVVVHEGGRDPMLAVPCFGLPQGQHALHARPYPRGDTDHT